MSDEKMAVNPFEEEFQKGGGLWEGRTVTVTGAFYRLHPIFRGSGDAKEPVLDESGEQSIRHELVLTGIADDQEFEHTESYSIGSLIPTADGEGVTKPDGSPVTKFHVNSEHAAFVKGLREGGFDTKLLYPDGKMKISNLVGARLVMEGVSKKNKDGDVKISKKGFPLQLFLPVKFVGMKAGVGAPAPVSDTLKSKTVAVVTAILKDNGGALGRADLARKLAATKDPDANKIMALISRDDFHKDVPWVRDSTSYRLA